MFRPSGAIDIDYNVVTKQELLRLSDAIGRVMAFDLGLTTVRWEARSSDGSIGVVGFRSVAALRDSAILSPGWREALDFDLELSDHRAIGQEAIIIHGVVHANVCRQALGTLAGYQGLDDAQRARYASVFDKKISDAIKSICSSYEQKDSSNITCQ